MGKVPAETALTEAGKELSFNGKEAISTPLQEVGYPYSVEFQLCPEKTNPISSILFQGPHSVVYTNWENTRRIAFSRDGYTFVFNSYRLPADQWTTIRIEGDYKGTSLYINGALQERLEGRTMQVYRKEYDRMEHMTYQETLIFPLQHIGDSRNGFKGKLKNILVRQQH